MNKPVLVIMAAGMGSRYGGLKQIDPVDEQGNIIMDFSIYDAVKAGFGKVVFIIKHQIEEEFKRSIGERIAKYVEVEYVFQELDKLPEGFAVPEGRVKPFGTGHAILCAKDAIQGPFAVINADDYYGSHAFEEIYKQLTTIADDDKYRYAMVGYELHKTLTENGHVARGVCVVDEDNKLVKINERTRIEKHGEDAECHLPKIYLEKNELSSVFLCNLLLYHFSVSAKLKDSFFLLPALSSVPQQYRMPHSTIFDLCFH